MPLLYNTLSSGPGTLRFTNLRAMLGNRLNSLPHVLRFLAENHLRNTQGDNHEELLHALDEWLVGRSAGTELTFVPSRLLMHDTTCTPALADIAALKDALAEAGGDPGSLFPSLPIDVSVDHSLAVESFASRAALSRNKTVEFVRNAERFAFMKWAAASMPNLRVHPPGTGIMHTINLEQLTTVLQLTPHENIFDAIPDSVLGTDSHTPMINGIGVLGWGIGGLEAENVMFGQPTTLPIPEIVGVRLIGHLQQGALSTDLALEVTHHLRKLGVSGPFVEFFGPGVATLSADDRAVVANMAPEYGATTGFFPPDDRVIDYLVRTGRHTAKIAVIKPVFQEMGLWFDHRQHPRFDREISIDLTELVPSIAGPRRPQDRRATIEARSAVEDALQRPLADPVPNEIPDGAIGIAAITSCTNTSDPRLLITAGLLARNANRRGLRPPPWVKTSLAPGSPSAQNFLKRAGLLEDLEALGFDIVGFGCTTCIGNSGPLLPQIRSALNAGKAVVAVLSGNRNFPGRVHPALDLGYLASPPLVIAYALYGDVRQDIRTTTLGTSANGTPVQLADIWPAEDEINAAMATAINPADTKRAFNVAARNSEWAALDAPVSDRFPWDPDSRYLRRPKFASLDNASRLGSYDAAPLAILGDDISTDHISPAGAIAPESEAGRWLIKHGSEPDNLNVYAAYRGNWEVMLRGLFTNRLAQNFLAPELASGETRVEGETEALTLHRAAEFYRQRNIPAILMAGERYGMGSSRDWAAKGVALLGVRAVIARSFERIHRTNLIGMGIAPIRILDGFVPANAGIRCNDRIRIALNPEELSLGQQHVIELITNGIPLPIAVRLDIETKQELTTLQAGGILPSILRMSLAHQKNQR
ncbi:aconitate hydratase AcnA [Paracoccus onubensis]|uniref:aconitate hydratase AcnA n=1 Tax=Paracoccus onubensis TaxID=1675788 RepID=UPI00273082D8|nr:aconitate hydratase AcnA [Paracoccus onubensis]MDP0929690.1 aconitate hydratase AcnA [Paracoccus onubensis]